jgi:hypothetical protein
MRKIFLKYDKQLTRILEILPGFVAWNLILFPAWGSFFFPSAVAYFILAFDVFWLYKSASLAVTATTSHFKIRASEKLDWMKEVKGFGDWQKVHHIVVIPTYKEPIYILRRTIKRLAEQTFPTKKLTVVLATEEREKEAKEKGELLKKEFGSKFGHFFITSHPDIPGEVKGKSSNEAWAGKCAKKKLVDEKGYDIDYLTITSLDADGLVHEQYFAYLTFKFLDSPQRYLRFWHSAVMFYNNYWRVPAPIRVVNTFGSIWRTGILNRRDRLIQMSVYSASLKMIDQVGYWDIDVIPEDYRIFFKCFFKLKGKVEVEPIFLPTYVDAAESTTYWKTMVNQYEQMKRWAWGVSDDPQLIKWWFTAPNVSFWDKTIHLLKVLEDHILWPVNWFIITLGVNIPTFLNPNFKRTAMGFTLPRFSSMILTTCLLFLGVILLIDARQRPPRPKHISKWRQLLMPLEFILMPVVGFFFNALPGLDAHTRLMLGKYLEYRVTEKV